MQIVKKAAVSAVTVGLLAFGAVVGVGGSAFAGQGPGNLITGCEAQVTSVSIGFQPNCDAIGGSIHDPTTIVIYLDTDKLATLIEDQEGQAMDASWTLFLRRERHRRQRSWHLRRHLRRADTIHGDRPADGGRLARAQPVHD